MKFFKNIKNRFVNFFKEKEKPKRKRKENMVEKWVRVNPESARAFCEAMDRVDEEAKKLEENNDKR